MLKSQPDYRSYLLRLWRVNSSASSSIQPSPEEWRASLEDPHTGEQLGFGSLAALFAFLEQQTGLAVGSVTNQDKIGNE